MLSNVLNLPAGVVPATRVTADDLRVPRNAGRDMWERLAAKVDEGSEGLPVGVQVVGLPWQEARVLRVMKRTLLDVRCAAIAIAITAAVR